MPGARRRVPLPDELEDLLTGHRGSKRATSAYPHRLGALVGTLVAFTDDVAVSTRWSFSPVNPGFGPHGSRRRSTCTGEHIGEDVVLAFEEGDAWSPIITRLTHVCLHAWSTAGAAGPGRGGCRRPAHVVTAKGTTRAALRQGQHHADQGRQGADRWARYVLEPLDAACNRIKGGSVQIELNPGGAPWN